MNTKNRGVVYVKARAEEFPGTESQNNSVIQDNGNRKEKRPYLNKIVKNFSPSKTQKKIKNLNNQNNHYKKNCVAGNNEYPYYNYNGETEIPNENFEEKKNKYNYDYNRNYKRDYNDYRDNNSSNKDYTLNYYHNNSDNNSGVKGSNENSFNYSYKYNNYNNNKNAGSLNSNSKVNNNDFNTRKNMIPNNTNSTTPIHNPGNYQNLGYVGGNFSQNKIIQHPGYMNSILSFNPYRNCNVGNLTHNNNIYKSNYQQHNTLHNQQNIYYNNNNFNKQDNTRYVHFLSNNNNQNIQNSLNTTNNLSQGVNSSNNEKHTKISEKIKPSSNTISQAFSSINTSQIIEEKIKIINTIYKENLRQGERLKISEKLNFPQSNFNDYKDKVTTKLYNNLLEFIKSSSNPVNYYGNQENVEAESKELSNVSSILHTNKPSNNGCNIDKNKLNYSAESLSNEESTGTSANDHNSDRGSHSLNLKKGIDLSVTQTFVPLNMSHEFNLTRNRLISDSFGFLKDGDKHRSFIKTNSFTPRKNTFNVKNERNTQFRRFKNVTNSFGNNNEKNKFNQFSFESHSTKNKSWAYETFKEEITNSNKKNVKVDIDLNKTTEGAQNLRNLGLESTNSDLHYKSNYNLVNFNLEEGKIDTNKKHIGLDCDGSSDTENQELITVRIKIDTNTSKEITIKKNQNILLSAKTFCEENKINPLLINSISNTIYKAISSINEVFNFNISESNRGTLENLEKFYNTKESEEDTESQKFTRTIQHNEEDDLENSSILNNLSCITLLHMDDDETSLMEDSLKNLNITW